MKRIYEAKKEYENIEVPSELNERVMAAIEQGSARIRKGFSFYAKTVLAPIVVCAAICIAIGLGRVSDTTPITPADGDVIAFARAMPEMAAAEGEKTSATPEVVQDETSWYLSYDEYISTETDEGCLPLKAPIQMIFTSGAGAWRTVITLNADGTFTGDYGDSDMGDADVNYPNGTHYTCSPFSGEFEDIKKINDYTYTMKLKTLSYDESEPSEYTDGGIRYIKTGPHGLFGGEEFVFYLPDAPVSALTEGERSWWHYGYILGENGALGACGLVNKKEEFSFFSDPFRDR